MLNVPFIVLQMQFLEKIGRIASEEVTLQLLYSKIMCTCFIIWSRSLSLEHFWLQISRLCHWQLFMKQFKT